MLHCSNESGAGLPGDVPEHGGKDHAAACNCGKAGRFVKHQPCLQGATGASGAPTRAVCVGGMRLEPGRNRPKPMAGLITPKAASSSNWSGAGTVVPIKRRQIRTEIRAAAMPAGMVGICGWRRAMAATRAMPKVRISASRSPKAVVWQFGHLRPIWLAVLGGLDGVRSRAWALWAAGAIVSVHGPRSGWRRGPAQGRSGGRGTVRR